MLTPYTTAAEVRGVLGVSDEELTDDVLALQLYEDALLADLYDVSTAVVSQYQTVSAVSSPTEIQKRFLQCVRSFSTYSVGRALMTSAPLFSPKSIEDGKAKQSRFDNPFKDMTKRIDAEFARWQTRLEDALTALGQAASAPVARIYASAVAPASNPITGE